MEPKNFLGSTIHSLVAMQRKYFPKFSIIILVAQQDLQTGLFFYISGQVQQRDEIRFNRKQQLILYFVTKVTCILQLHILVVGFFIIVLMFCQCSINVYRMYVFSASVVDSRMCSEYFLISPPSTVKCCIKSACQNNN